MHTAHALYKLVPSIGHFVQKTEVYCSHESNTEKLNNLLKHTFMWYFLLTAKWSSRSWSDFRLS